MPVEDEESIKKAIIDGQSVKPDGTSIARLAHGVTFHNSPTHADGRGTVTELFDKRWNWHPSPVDFVYSFTIRPGRIKGWGLHKLHEDRYFVLQGEMEIVMYDVRPDSPTYREVSRVVLSETNRRIMNIPTHIWHANHNIGSKDVVVVNFPTIPYDHANPDKYRLPLDTDLIPYSFGEPRGW